MRAQYCSSCFCHFHFVDRSLSHTAFRAGGIWGVELFFALSGFLITGLLYRVFENVSLAGLRIYLVRRWMRTLPLYVTALVLLGVVDGGLFGFPMTKVERYPLFLQTLDSGRLSWFGVSWSLCVEEWSYVLIPCAALCLCFVRNLDLRFTLIFAVAIAACTAWRLSLGADGVQFDPGIRRALLPRLDALAYGGLLQIAWRRYGDRLLAIRFPLLAVSVAGQAVCYLLYDSYGGADSFVAACMLTLLTPSLCCAFPAAMALERMPAPVQRISEYFATRAYALYLFHFPLYSLIYAYLGAAPIPLKLILAVGVAVVVADTAYRRIEKPIMDRRPAERAGYGAAVAPRAAEAPIGAG